MKPYIFNNYEKTLPDNLRGQYKSYPADENKTSTPQLPLTEGILLVIDLTDVKNKKEVIEKFYTKFGFLKANFESWDSLGDYMWYLKESSAIFTQINPSVIQLRVVNINHIWSFSEKDYAILCEILVTSTDNSRFSDGFRLILEVQNDTI